MSFGGTGTPPLPEKPPPPPNPPMYGSEAVRKKAGGLNMPSRPTFLGGDLTQQAGGMKTLLGQ